MKVTYIVREPSGLTPCLYRVNVATGEEKLVRVNEIPTPSKGDLLHIVAMSKGEYPEYDYQSYRFDDYFTENTYYREY